MSKRDQVIKYASQIKLDDNDQVFADCLERLAQAAVASMQINDPASLLQILLDASQGPEDH